MLILTDIDHLTNDVIVASFAHFLCFPQFQYLLEDVALDHTRLHKIPFQVRMSD